MKHVYCVEGHRDMLQAQNRVTLNTDVRDQWVLPVANVHFGRFAIQHRGGGDLDVDGRGAGDPPAGLHRPGDARRQHLIAGIEVVGW